MPIDEAIGYLTDGVEDCDKKTWLRGAMDSHLSLMGYPGDEITIGLNLFFAEEVPDGQVQDM
ncbi:hypothetical protein HGB07_05900 [Candidatus Roizmanbacteria bacterium]|nr:hypothetical protein [Candidatus Roizmanbacteria bacterium]